MRQTIHWDKLKLERFRLAYATAHKANADHFTFEGSPFLVAYARYLLEYLDSIIPEPRPQWIVAMVRPDGGREYIPEGFGFTCHAHVTDRSLAKRHATQADATRSIVAYWFPPAFWESERQHALIMAERFKGWRYEVERVP